MNNDDSQIKDFEDFEGLKEWTEHHWKEILRDWNHKDWPIDENGIATLR